MAASTAISSTTIVTSVSRPAEKADGEFSAASPAPIIATAVSKLAIEKRSPLIAPILPQHARCAPSLPWTIRKWPESKPQRSRWRTCWAAGYGGELQNDQLALQARVAAFIEVRFVPQVC